MNKDRSTPQSLDEILCGVMHSGPVPPPSEDEMMDMVVDVIHTARAEKASAGEPLPPPDLNDLLSRPT